jgi:hypothetical protein
MNLHVFTTGRGTPYGLAEVPGDQGGHPQRPGAALARPDGHQRRPHRRRREEHRGVGWELFHRLLLDVASGRKT